MCLSAKSSWWLHALELALRSLKKRRGQRWGNGSMACSSCSWEVATSLGQAWPKFISETTWSLQGVPFPKSSPSFFHLEELYFKIRELCVLDPGETHRGIDFPCFLQLMLPDKIHSLGVPEENGSLLLETSRIQVEDFFFEIFSVIGSLLQIGKDPCLLNVMGKY